MADGTFPTVAVVGAGAAGTLTAARLLDAADTLRLPVDVQLIDPAPATGQGAAYATIDTRHLMNVPAGRLSARTDWPDDFTGWLSAQLARKVGPEEFVPRLHYGHYLSAHLARSLERTALGRFRRRHERVVDLTPESRPRLLFASGGGLRADAVVLATGQPGSRPGWSRGLAHSPRFISDPWSPHALDAVPRGADVLLVGTGLTMVDVALTLTGPGRVVHAVSRHGLVPQRHTVSQPSAIPPPPYGDCGDLAALRRMILHQAAVCRRLHGDWRPAVDGLRPWTAALWQRLSLDDRRRFLAEDHRDWEVHRHRMPPQTADALAVACAQGTIRITKGQLTRVTPTARGVRIGLSTGRTLYVGAVVNCTGPARSVHEYPGPLWAALLGNGTARPGPLDLGLDTAPDGRLIPADGRPPAPVWTVGALRLGNLWETTAIPEIRVQAAEVATALLARLTRPTTPHAVRAP